MSTKLRNLKKSKSCAARKVSKVMHEWKTKRLRSSGKRLVRGQKQAIAIALSEARRTCGKRSVVKPTRRLQSRKRK